MTTTLQLTLKWTDEFITWNKSVYSNDLYFYFNEIWTPSLTAANNLINFKMNSVKGYELDLNFYDIFDLEERKKYLISINSEGECMWKYPIKLITLCQLNQDTFPFDSQECFVDFRTAAYYSKQLSFTSFSGSGVTIDQLKVSEFDLVTAKSEIHLFPLQNYRSDFVSMVRVTLVIKRKMVFYTNKIILPYFVFYVATLFTYVLPIETGEKKSLSSCILISSFYCFKDCLSFVSKTSFLSLLSIYFNMNLIFVFACIVMSTLIYLIYYAKRRNKPLPKLFDFLFNRKQISRTKEMLLSELKKSIESNFEKLGMIDHKQSNGPVNANLKEAIRNDLDNLNSQIMDFKDNSIFISPNNLSFSLTHFWGFKQLNILKNFKKILKAYNNTQKLNYGHSLIGFTDPNYKNVNRIEVFDSNIESLKILRLMNTLESLKLEIMNQKTVKKKSKSLSKINLSNNSFNDIQYKQNDKNRSFVLLNAQMDSYDYLDDMQRTFENQQNVRNALFFLEKIKEYKSQIKSRFGNLEIQVGSCGKFYNTKSYNDQRYVNEWKIFAMQLDKNLFYFFVIIVTVFILYLYLKAVVLI